MLFSREHEAIKAIEDKYVLSCLGVVYRIGSLRLESVVSPWTSTKTPLQKFHSSGRRDSPSLGQ
jgi:hypothetical protein